MTIPRVSGLDALRGPLTEGDVHPPPRYARYDSPPVGIGGPGSA